MDFIADDRPDVGDLLSSKAVQELLADPKCSLRLLTLSGRYLYVSKGVEELLGYPANEFVTFNAFDIVHPEEVPVVNQARKALQQGPVELIVRAKHKKGHYEWVSTRMMLSQGLMSVAVLPTTGPPGGAMWAPAPPFV